MSKWLRRAAVPFMAGAAIALATTSVWAFTQETLHPNTNGNYNFNYGPLDDSAKSGQGLNKSDPNSSGFHFSIEHGQQTSPFGFRSFGDDSNQTFPDYVPRPGR